MIGVILITCEIGQQFTNALGKVNDQFEQLDWYLFPAKVQRMLPTIINNVQDPVEIGCFGIMYCSREQFKTVKHPCQVFFTGKEASSVANFVLIHLSGRLTLPIV